MHEPKASALHNRECECTIPKHAKPAKCMFYSGRTTFDQSAVLSVVWGDFII